MCSNVVVQHYTAHAPYHLHTDDVRGDVLRPPHGTTLAAVKIKLVLNEDPLEYEE